MPGYQYDAVWNTYRLDPGTRAFSLAEEHGQGIAHVQGNAESNDIAGNDADNRLDGGSGADTLAGGLGNDAYVVDNSGDVVVERAGEGEADLVTSYVTYTLPDHVEVLVLQGFETLTGTGNAGNNILIGSDGGSDLLQGLGGNDRLFGYASDDTLDGGEGADNLWGWWGNDTFIVDNPGDIVIEDPDRGEDRVIASVGHTLSAHVEHLRLVGLQGLAGIGNGLDNQIIGGLGNDTLEGRDGHDTLDGGAGADVLRGGAGDDLYRIDRIDDVIGEEDGGGTDRVETAISLTLAAFVENLLALGLEHIALSGNALDNRIEGNVGANTLDGAAGADTLAGGAGDDVYIIDSGDTLIEADGGGTDRVEASFSYTLGDHLEHLSLSGSQPLTGRGNGLANRIMGAGGADLLEGLGGNDTLVGGAGGDTLRGGAGDDVYHVDAGDMVEELSGDGSDTVVASSSHSLAAHVENLVAEGTAAVSLTGNALANRLVGNGAANTLDGGAGADTLEGGTGDDVYQVDGLDQVIEAAGGGTDTVIAEADHSLAGWVHVENLMASGAGAVALAGNGLANRITGNAAANRLSGDAGSDTLDGGAGADLMAGGAGDDTFVVDSTGDQVVEDSGGGRDTVLTSSGYSLSAGSEIEVLAAAGPLGVLLKGNAFANIIAGHAGADRLHGGLGNDVLNGGAGKDCFVFDSKPQKAANRDILADFSVRDDSIWLENRIFKKLGLKGSEKKPALLGKDFFVKGSKAKDKDDHVIYDAKKGVLLYDADGSGKGRAVEIATLSKNLAITHKDFFVI